MDILKKLSPKSWLFKDGKLKKRTKILLIAALLICLISAFCASLT